MKLIIGALLVAVSGLAGAKCNSADKWSGGDKGVHFVAGAAVAAFVGATTEDPWQGFLWGAGASAAKELLDSTGVGACTKQDLAFGLAGAAAGALGAKFILIPAGRRAVVAVVNVTF